MREEGGTATSLGGVKLPSEAWSSGADLVKKLIILEGFGSGDVLYGLFNYRRCFCEGLGESFHIEGHNWLIKFIGYLGI